MKEGQLLLINRQDSLAYHLYDSKTVTSFNINKFLKNINNTIVFCRIYDSDGELIFSKNGKLSVHMSCDVEKIYIDDFDLEEYLFNSTEKFIKFECRRLV